ncbi:MAG: L-threonylcarbamoyladenylate synthase [Ferruginibacter sp.]
MITTNIDIARQALIANEIVAIPTETVYGLAANAYSETAVKKIFELKNRPLYNPLIVHIRSADFLPEVAVDIPPIAYEMARQYWPGPLTMILQKQSHIPGLVTAGKETVAIRVPDHPLTLSLLEQLDFPLAAPSANPFGSISSTTAQHVADYFKDSLQVVLDGGPCRKGLESTIIGVEHGRPVLYRPGAVSMEDIEQRTGKLIVQTKGSGHEVVAPGMLLKHYSPSTRTYLTSNVKEYLELLQDKKAGLLLFKDRIENDAIKYQEILSVSGDMEEAARNLYAAMHRLDKLGLDLIIAERLPEHGLGKTINDRLQRATEQ